MFSKNLKDIRIKCGYSQKYVAEYLNISAQSISKWEKGDALPSITFLPQLAECLSCDINDFFVENNDNSFDLVMLEDFFEFFKSYFEDKSEDKFRNLRIFLEKYPDIATFISEFKDIFSQKQIINRKTFRDILGCTDCDVDKFIDYFIDFELIEKVDFNDTYIVIKSNFQGLVFILDTSMTTLKYIEKLQ